MRNIKNLLIVLQNRKKSKTNKQKLFKFIGFPIERGRRSLRRNPSWTESICETVKFRPYAFYPDKPVHVQATVNHWNTTDPDYVHDASVTWVQNVNYDGFTVCVTQAGRNDRPKKTLASVDWIAYQGAPPGGVADRVRISAWWTGTTCKTITFPQVNTIKISTVSS